MGIVVLKVALAPALVCGATLVARRWGDRVGGVVIALPVVAGPILLVIALEQGAAFGAQTARGAILGVVALCAYTVVFARAAGRVPWPAAVGAAWVAFAGLAVGLAQVEASTAVRLLLAAGAIAAARVAIGPAPAPEGTPLVPPSWDLPARALVTGVLVVAVTSAARQLGPSMSGVLTPVPVAISVLAAFTLAHRGPPALVATLRGFTTALPGFTLFFAAVALVLD